MARDGHPMRRLSPENAPGKAEKLYAKFMPGTSARIDELAARKGLNRSEYFRRALAAAIATDEAEEAAQAS